MCKLQRPFESGGPGVSKSAVEWKHARHFVNALIASVNSDKELSWETDRESREADILSAESSLFDLRLRELSLRSFRVCSWISRSESTGAPFKVSAAELDVDVESPRLYASHIPK